MRALAALLVLAGAARAEQPCEPSPEVQSTIAAARGEKDATERLKHLVAAHPDDVFAQEAWADRASLDDYAGVRAQYKALYEKNPSDPRYAYLYARLVSYANAKEALALLQALDYSRAHLMRAQKLSAQKDEPGARQALDRYAAACPRALDGWSLRLRLAGKKQPAEAAKLRAILAARTDTAALAAYGTLWKAEFKAAAPAKHASLRKQVAADLGRMRAAAPAPDPAVLRAFDEGYKITSDADGKAWVKAQAPDDSHAFMDAFSAWMRSHPDLYPGEKATRAAREAHRAAQYAASAEWTRTWPRQQLAWDVRLTSAPRDLPAAEVKKIGDTLLGLDDSNIGVAWTFAQRKIDVAKVPSLVARIQAKSARELANQRAQPERFGAEMIKMLDSEETNLQFTAWDALSRAYSVLGNAAGLRDVEAKLKAAVDAERGRMPADDEEDNRKSHEAELWLARGRLALLDHKKADALGYFAKAHTLTPDEDDDEARALWKELGGSDDGWTALTARDADAKKPEDATWKKKELSLPAFTLTDLAGKTWKSSDLKGKTVLLVSWATWCGPCKEELPHLEKLYQQTRKRADVVVASLNVDQEVGLVEPFIKENKYSFPVLLSSDWASDLRGGGIPLGWIADRAFVVRLEKLGYDDSGKWVEDTLAAIDRVAKPQTRE